LTKAKNEGFPIEIILENEKRIGWMKPYREPLMAHQLEIYEEAIPAIQQMINIIFIPRLRSLARSRKSILLMAVVSHIGQTPIAGHYISFCAIDNQWWKFNDESVEAVESDAVFQDNFPNLFLKTNSNMHHRSRRHHCS
jgi:hypothetical protein